MTSEQERTEARAEAADDKAYEASMDASRFGFLAAMEANTEASHLKAAKVYMAAAGAYSEAAQAQQDHADAGGIDAAGRAAEYADTPAEAAKQCRDEAERYASQAKAHERTAAKIKAEEAEGRMKYLVKVELAVAVDSMQTPAQMVDHLLSSAYEQTQYGLLLDWEHLETSDGSPLDPNIETEMAEVKAEQAEQEADRVSSLAADASDRALDINTKEAHFLAAQAQDRAAHANSMAAITHQAHADAGGIDAAGSAANYADSPAQAAKACQTEIERFEAEAAFHREEAAKLVS